MSNENQNKNNKPSLIQIILDSFKKENKRDKNSKSIRIVIYMIIVFILFNICYYVGKSATAKAKLAEENKQYETYHTFMAQLHNGDVGAIYYSTTEKILKYALFNEQTRAEVEELRINHKNTAEYVYPEECIFYTYYPSYTEFRKEALESKSVVDMINLNNTKAAETFLSFGMPILSLLIMVGILYYFMRKMTNPMGDKANIMVENSDKTFKDVIGLDEVLDDVKQITEMIKHPELGKELGAKTPSGVLFVGPPGTGKTLIARAMAGEIGLPFISANASGFVELYAGMGAKKVRHLFDEARKHKPCIVFIDELDGAGKKRTSGGLDNREGDQTLLALLSEMSGFTELDGVFIIGATNKLEDLDPALVRSGRFDRHIMIMPPRTWQDRLKIFNYYTQGLKLDESVSLESVSKQTPNFTPADIEAVCNEAALIALKQKFKAITQDCFEEAIDKKLLNGNRKKAKNDDSERSVVAYHEAGHAVAKFLLEMPISRATIIATTSGVGGFVMGEDTENKLTTKKDMINEIMVCYAGRASELIKFGEITIGASNDIMQATNQLKIYTASVGFDESCGMLDYNQLQSAMQSVEPMLLERMKTLSNAYYKDTVSLLQSNYQMVEYVAQALLEKETLSGSEITELCNKAIAETKNEM